ncbi:MAG TPA: hypothetical protein VGB84_03700 [Arachidicoccus sp.]
MKQITAVVALLFTIQFSFAQNLRNNKFDLPVVENEIAFFELDSVPNLTQADFYQFGKDWFEQTYSVNKFSADNKKTGDLSGSVTFKIDDQNVKAPLNYSAKVTLKFINGVASIKLHGLKYISADTKSKSSVNVTYEVKQQMLAKTDELYPDSWNSLKSYANDLMQNFADFISDKNMEKL